MCAGLFSSGSTWAFNVVARLLERSNQKAVAPLYADDADDAIASVIAKQGPFVLKTHYPSETLRALFRAGGLQIVMTIREPKDAVASLMLRFSQDFPTALHRVDRSANVLVEMHAQFESLLLRYESGFVGECGVVSIAKHLGLAVAASESVAIARDLSADSVHRHVHCLLMRGVFSGANPAEEWEQTTQWHPGHIGDQRVGKFRDVLTPEEIKMVDDATLQYQTLFGYAPASTV